MSPQMAILSPLMRPNRSRSVSMSSSPWVGCSCLPSPALMTLDRMRWPRNCAAPDAPWRITTMSIRMASRFFAVSTRVSPLLTEDPTVATLTVSAESRFSANSKEMRVRVEASKNRLTMVLPRSAGTFLIARSLTSLKGSAVSRMSWICSALSGSSPTRSLPSDGAVMVSAPPHQFDGIAPVHFGHEDIHSIFRTGADAGPDDVRLDRQLPSPAVDQHTEQDPPRPAKVGELIERRADCSAGIEHVVHDNDGLTVDIGQPGLAHYGAGTNGLQIVSIEGDVELTGGDVRCFGGVDVALQAIRQLDPAALNADQHQFLGA